MKRGEIYYIQRRNDLSIGSETMKSRPAVIVSSNALNATSEVVEVVYLTTSPKKELPTHASINATGVESTVLCEQIDRVSIHLVGDYCGTCSVEEMAGIDAALMCSLGLANKPGEDLNKWQTLAKTSAEAMRNIMAERDRYAKVLDMLLRERSTEE
jgi:mRNA interferase MazF